MSDRRRSGQGKPVAVEVRKRVRPARLVSQPHSTPATESAERDLRAALRQQLFDGFEKGEGWPLSWDLAWAESGPYRAQLQGRAPALRMEEAHYRELLALDWRRWCDSSGQAP